MRAAAAIFLAGQLLHSLRNLAAEDILDDNIDARKGSNGAHDGRVNSAHALSMQDAHAVGGDAKQDDGFDQGNCRR